MYTSTYASSYNRRPFRLGSVEPEAAMKNGGSADRTAESTFSRESVNSSSSLFSAHNKKAAPKDYSSSPAEVHTTKPLNTSSYTSSASLYPIRTWKSELNLARDYKESEPKNYTSTYNTLINNMTVQPSSSYNKEPSRMKIYTGLPMSGSSGRLDVNMLFSQVARINDHLFLCSVNALSPQKLQSYGITLVVSAMIDPPPSSVRASSVSNLHVCIEDMETANLKLHFDRVADRIAHEQAKGGKAVVHCMAGVSRSTSLVLAYLMKYQNMTLAQAFQHVRAIRPCVHPNAGFWRQLVEYEKKLKGCTSVELTSPSTGLTSYLNNSYSVGMFGGGRYRTPTGEAPPHQLFNNVPHWNELDRNRSIFRPSSQRYYPNSSLFARY